MTRLNNMNKYTKAALVADALSLGPHWIYNPGKLTRLYPHGIYALTDPASQYHPHKQAGQFTHYGDQLLLLQQSISALGRFDPEHWRTDWLDAMVEYHGYMDGASKDTLATNATMSSDSNDLAGASRLAPLLDLKLGLDDAIVASRAQTALTHGDLGVQDAAEFFTRVVYAIIDGATIAVALDRAAQQGQYSQLPAKQHIITAKIAIESSDNDVQVATRIGTTCHLPEAFPLSLYFLLKPKINFASVISANGLVGGDTSARAMLIAVVFAARDGDVGAALVDQLDKSLFSEQIHQQRKPLNLVSGANALQITSVNGNIAGTLELPENPVRAYAIFAHCFTCGKDFVPEKRITQALAAHGIASVRIDFSGIGASSGQFVDSSFLTNLQDLLTTADWMTANGIGAKLLIGHSLGGTAALAVAGQIEGVKAVVSIGSPYLPDSIIRHFPDHLDEIQTQGKAEVCLAGRAFTIGKKFLDDLKQHDQIQSLSHTVNIHKLIMHAPNDDTISIKQAGFIFSALAYPKSFIALTGANHLLTDKDDAKYAAEVINAWFSIVLRDD